MTGTKELNNLLLAANKYIEKHKGKVSLILDVCAFKGKECDVIDDRIMIFGLKESILIQQTELLKVVEKEKEEFIAW